jgi:ATP-dependent DNA ligase
VTLGFPFQILLINPGVRFVTGFRRRFVTFTGRRVNSFWCKVVKRSSDSGLVPNFVEPMKAKLAGSIPTGAWTFEIKFDGYRALALRGGNTTRLLSRNEKDLGKKFPEIVNAIAALDVHDAIIDGEIVALDENGRPSFQLLQGFDMGQERPPIVYYPFDLLRLNGKDLRASPIEERKAKLAALLQRPGDCCPVFALRKRSASFWTALVSCR